MEKKKMNKKTTSSIIAYNILMLLFIVNINPTVTAADPTIIEGYVSVDEVITTPDNVKAVFSLQEYNANISGNPVGFYVIDVYEKIGKNGVFYVKISNSTWKAAQTVTINASNVIYINLTINTSDRPIVEDDTEPPSKVTGLTVIDNENGKIPSIPIIIY